MAAGQNWNCGQRRLLIAMTTVIAVIAAIWFARAASVFVMPLAAAFFLAILVRPIHVFLQRKLPKYLNWLSLPATALAIIGVLAIGLGLLWLCIMLVVEAVPRYSGEFSRMVENVRQLAKRYDFSLDGDINSISNITDYLVGLTTTIVSSLSYIVAMLTLIFFLAILLLVEWDSIQRRARSTISDSSSRGAVDTLNAVASRIRRYLLVRTAISALSGIAAWITLALMDVDLALLWGVIIFLLNYVPNIGSIISMLPPAFFAVMQHGFWYGVLVWLVLGALELLIGNYIDPRVESRTLKVSSLLVLISIIFWGWVWGIPGMILGVPMTITMITIFKHIAPLRPVATLLTSEEADEDDKSPDTSDNR